MRADKYLAVMKMSMTDTFHHASNLLGRGAVVLFRLWIFTTLYHVTYRSIGASKVQGLTVNAVIWLLVFTQSFRQSGWPVPARIIDEEVKSGALAYSINRPYSYAFFHFFSFFGRIGPNLLVNLGIATVAALIFVGPLTLTPWAIMGGVTLLVGSYVLEFFFSFSIGMLAFWVEDTAAFQWIYFKGQLIFGGLIVPLSLFPAPVRAIGEKLPFASMYYSSARTLVGYDAAAFQHYLLLQMIWIVIAASTAFVLFQKGVRNVALNGG